MNHHYSPKEILILESAVNIFLESSSLHNVKVADIAAGAGIGKGTVYEYFSSKEEIILKAVAYRIWQELENFGEEVAAAPDFFRCTRGILTKTLDCITNFSSYLMLRSELLNFGNDTNPVDSVAKVLIDKECEVINAYLDLGIKEGIIDSKKAQAAGFQTVISALVGFNLLSRRPGDIPQSELIDGVYQIITGTLSK